MHQLLLQYVWHLANDRLSEAKFHFVDFFFIKSESKDRFGNVSTKR